MKTCSKCKELKENIDFSPSQFELSYGICRVCVKKAKAEYRVRNKEKSQKQAQDYYQANKGVILTRANEYNQENKSKIAETKKEYFQKNKIVLLDQRKEYKSNKRKNDPNFRLRENVSASVRQALKLNDSSKLGHSFLNFTTYSVKELKSHLEDQFEPWMTWDNWGVYNSKIWNDNDNSTWTWQIDHIVPQSKLPYTSMEDENFKKCWALENLRPLSAKQNIIDGNRRAA